MHLHYRHSYGCYGIGYGKRCVGICPGIQYHTGIGRVKPYAVQLIDQSPSLLLWKYSISTMG